MNDALVGGWCVYVCMYLGGKWKNVCVLIGCVDLSLILAVYPHKITYTHTHKQLRLAPDNVRVVISNPEDGDEMAGVMATKDALAKAKEMGLDLIMISENGMCRLVCVRVCASISQ